MRVHKLIHKPIYDGTLLFWLCDKTEARIIGEDNSSYYWKDVTCKDCLKLKGCSK